MSALLEGIAAGEILGVIWGETVEGKVIYGAPVVVVSIKNQYEDSDNERKEGSHENMVDEDQN